MTDNKLLEKACAKVGDRYIWEGNWVRRLNNEISWCMCDPLNNDLHAMELAKDAGIESVDVSVTVGISHSNQMYFREGSVYQEMEIKDYNRLIRRAIVKEVAEL